ncbi:Uu.00g065840.m01.CDS01 [Anthostomella pinea]|uniref:Uu.00g065840.m01.CDS01 n=1 Tax=Anthostomella pinea TaxID=933095 RepID=A0AAI8VTW0_9PEZI|nr:Uu.00g065840.m01.CDS01 [Anthostomella pinea]
MPSTPGTSFSSDEKPSRRVGKKQKREIPFSLPSPHPSDTYPAEQSPSEASQSEAPQSDEPNPSGDEVQDIYELPSIQEAFETIRDHARQLPPESESATFDLGGQEAYIELHRRLEESKLLEVFRELRKEWDACTGILIIRLMPASPLHEALQNHVTCTIHSELNRVAREFPALKPFRDKIIGSDHAAVQTGRSQIPTFESSPDGQMSYLGPNTTSSPFLFEVAYSQSDKDLCGKVMNYFNNGHGIMTVLTLNVEHAAKDVRKAESHSHCGRVSLYTITYEDEGAVPDGNEEGAASNDVVDTSSDDDTLANSSDDSAGTLRRLMREVFRDAGGNAQQGEVAIPFECFLPRAARSSASPAAKQATVRLSFEGLATALANGEALQRSSDIAPSRKRKAAKWVMVDEEQGVFQRVARPKRQKTKSLPRRSSRVAGSSVG